ncbi:MAG: VCBS repeat-containing protein [Desulfobacteraceae bacterium]|nr:MAG: VCBS repeat-containing protein [Desulfobacteraceae bacterium]
MKSLFRVFILTVVPFFLFVSTVISEVSFQEPSNYGVGQQPNSIIKGDFNEDGDLDLVLACLSSTSNNVFVLLGNGDGTFTVANSFSVGNALTCITTGDFNADTHLDLAATEYEYISSGMGRLFTLLGNGDGTFQDAGSYDAAYHPWFVRMGDFDKDGNLDLVVAATDYWAVYLWKGNGDGTFQVPKMILSIVLPRFVVSGDLNDDTALDLVVASPEKMNDENVIYVLLGNGDGTFQNPRDNNAYYPTGGIPKNIAIGDFNGDTRLDLAVTNSSPDNVSILLGNGDGTFAVKVDYGVGPYPIPIVAGDFDNNTATDLIAGNFSTNTIYILRGKGDGTFEDAGYHEVGQAPSSMVNGDFNEDGSLDLAVANYSSNNVSVLINSGNTDNDNDSHTFCFIATAAYGSPFTSYVKTLGEFRDRFLLTNTAGTMLVNLYYSCSPPVAAFISKHEHIKMLVRWSLLPLVGISYLALHYGVTITALVVIFPLSLMIFVFVLFRRKFLSARCIGE